MTHIIFATYNFFPPERHIFVSSSQKWTPCHRRTIHSTDCTPIPYSVIFIHLKLKLVSGLSRFIQLHTDDLWQFFPWACIDIIWASACQRLSVWIVLGIALWPFFLVSSALLHFWYFTWLHSNEVHSLHISAQVAIVTVLLICIYYSWARTMNITTQDPC